MKQVFAGIDIGGTSIKYAAICDGAILLQKVRPSQAESDQETVIDNIVSCIHELADAHKLTAVGIGTPGLVDVATGFVKGGAYNLPQWENLPLGSILNEKTGLPVFVDNDANLMGFGEYAFQDSLGNNVIFITIGTGIGGAIIIGGQLFRGSRYAGAELGCIPLEVDGKEGFWEDFAATSAMISHYQSLLQETPTEKINGKFLFKRYLEKEAAAVQAVERNTLLLGKGVAAYINIFNPDQIIIGGGVSEAGEWYIDKIRKVAEQYAMEDCLEGVRISGARFGNKAGFLGAARFAQLELEKL